MKKFELGQTVMTQGIQSLCDNNDLFHSKMMVCLQRHQSGDWGDMPTEDKKDNDQSLIPMYQGRLFSAYDDVEGTKIWIITEWDRSVTTILLPKEY